MPNDNDPGDMWSKRIKRLLHMFNLSRRTLQWIMSPTNRDIELPLFHRSFASGSGLSVVIGMFVVPAWVQTPNSMLAFIDVVTKFPMTIAFPTVIVFFLYAVVFALLQPLGDFSEHFMRGFLIIPFLTIHYYILSAIINMLVIFAKVSHYI